MNKLIILRKSLLPMMKQKHSISSMSTRLLKQITLALDLHTCVYNVGFSHPKNAMSLYSIFQLHKKEGPLNACVIHYLLCCQEK